MALSYLQKANYFVTDNLKGKLEQNQQQQTNLPLLRSVQNKPQIPLILQNLYFQKTDILTALLKKRLQGGGCGFCKKKGKDDQKQSDYKRDETEIQSQESVSALGKVNQNDVKVNQNNGKVQVQINQNKDQNVINQKQNQKDYEKMPINDDNLGKQQDTLKENIMKDMSESLNKLFNKFKQIKASYSYVAQQLEKLDIVNDQNPFEFIKSQLGHFQSFFKEINKISSDQEAQNFLQEI